tara:strand:+ start:133 stop:378 length:246 start_codon:yes stop_codon:yes gene_type:complete
LIETNGETIGQGDIVATHSRKDINNIMSAMRYYLNNVASPGDDQLRAADAFYPTAHRAQEEAIPQSWVVLSLIKDIQDNSY